MTLTARIRYWARVAVLLGAGSWTLLAAPSDEPRAAHAQVAAQEGWLGVVLAEESAPQRVLIKEVLPGSPAQQAGLRPQDQLVRLDGHPIQRARQVSQTVSQHRAGFQMLIDVLRQGQPLRLSARLGTYPGAEQLLRLQHVGRPARALGALQPISQAAPTSLAALRGQVVVLEFWAPWCEACRAQVPQLNSWQQRYGAQGLTVLGVAIEPAEELAQQVRRMGIHYAASVDPSLKAPETFGIRELPSVLLIDRRGVVRDATTGYDPRRLEQLETHIRQLLTETR